MNKICTSIEQSQKLLELGVDIYTADMFWKNGVSDKYIQCFNPFVGCGTDIDYDYDVPAWSLSALLRILPVYISGSRLRMDISKNDFNLWFEDLSSGTADESLPDITKENPVDACYEMILKLHEQKLL